MSKVNSKYHINFLNLNYLLLQNLDIRIGLSKQEIRLLKKQITCLKNMIRAAEANKKIVTLSF